MSVLFRFCFVCLFSHFVFSDLRQVLFDPYDNVFKMFNFDSFSALEDMYV